MNRKQLGLLISLSSLFGGCALFSPSYVAPQVDAPQSLRNGSIIESSSQDFSQLAWWNKFNDLTLDNLIMRALHNNNQLKIAQANISQAQAQLKAAQYAWIPTLNASGLGLAGNTYATNLTPQGSLSQLMPNGSVGNTNFSVWQGGFVPSYSFNVFANINQTKLAKASLELQTAAANATKLSIIGQVSGAYFMLLGQRKQLLLQQQTINDLTSLYQLQELKVKVGNSDNLSLTLLQQQLEDARSKLPAIENSIAQTENALQILLGNNPGAITTTRDIDDYDLQTIIPANLPSAVLKNRPDILMAEDNLKMANANIGLANATFFPTISLTGDIGAASVALSNLFSMGTGFWFVQAAANMPILNASSFEQVKAAKGGYYVAYYNYMQTVKSAFADVDNSLTNQDKVNQQYLAGQKSQAASWHYYQLVLAQYQIGTGNKISLLNAKLVTDSALLNLNQLKMQQLASIVQVYQSLAGGYNVTESAIPAHSANEAN